MVVEGTKEEAVQLYVSYMQDLIDAIRIVDTKHIICIEEFQIRLINKAKGTAETVYPTVFDYFFSDHNYVIDSHSYSPTLYAMQKEGDNIPYDIYIVRDEVWRSNLNGITVKELTPQEYRTVTSTLLPLQDNRVNTGVVKIEVNGEGASVIMYNANLSKPEKKSKKK